MQALRQPEHHWLQCDVTIAVQHIHREYCLSCCAGITRERLESFDRPIKVEPEDYPDKRDALISEFRNYLAILKVWFPTHQSLYSGLTHVKQWHLLRR